MTTQTTQTTQITAQLVPAAIAFTANPGDILVIVNGVCLGPQEAPASEAPEAPEAPEAKRIYTPRNMPISDSTIVKALTKKPLYTKAIGDKLGISRSDTKTRAILSYRLSVLRTNGTIQGDAPNRLWRYSNGQ